MSCQKNEMKIFVFDKHKLPKEKRKIRTMFEMTHCISKREGKERERETIKEDSNFLSLS